MCEDCTIKFNLKTVTPFIKKAFQLCFRCSVGDQDKSWTPRIVCANYAVIWEDGWNVLGSPFRFMFQWSGENEKIIWQTYSCLTKVSGNSLKSEHSIQ
jgi:hypothetical protein